MHPRERMRLYRSQASQKGRKSGRTTAKEGNKHSMRRVRDSVCSRCSLLTLRTFLMIYCFSGRAAMRSPMFLWPCPGPLRTRRTPASRTRTAAPPDPSPSRTPTESRAPSHCSGETRAKAKEKTCAQKRYSQRITGVKEEAHREGR